MTDHSAIDAATRRLQLALDGLDAALAHRREADVRDAALADQVHTLHADRARLAAELDHAAERTQQLETTSREIADRLDSAMTAIRVVMAAQDD